MEYYRNYAQLQKAALLNITDADELAELASSAGPTRIYGDIPTIPDDDLALLETIV